MAVVRCDTIGCAYRGVETCTAICISMQDRECATACTIQDLMERKPESHKESRAAAPRKHVFATGAGLTAKQKEFHTLEDRIAVVTGGRRSGKTYALLSEIEKYKDIADFSGLYVSTGGVMYACEQLARMFPVNTLQFVPAQNLVIFPSGAKMRFRVIRTMEDAFSLGGLEFDLVLVDGSSNFTHDQLGYLKHLNRSCKGIKPKIRLSADNVGCSKGLANVFSEPVKEGAL